MASSREALAGRGLLPFLDRGGCPGARSCPATRARLGGLGLGCAVGPDPPARAHAAGGSGHREAEVCSLIASGRNKTAVAEYLSLSENTVRTHSKNAYAELGVHTKEEPVELIERTAARRGR